jgi:hypothetical protein
MLVDQIDRLRGKDLTELQKTIEDKLYYNRNLSLDMIKKQIRSTELCVAIF